MKGGFVEIFYGLVKIKKGKTSVEIFPASGVVCVKILRIYSPTPYHKTTQGLNLERIQVHLH